MTAPAIERLLAIMRRLRDPQTGCPWDIEQTFATIAPYTIEEAYEVADAIARGDLADLKEELGDLLLHVIYHSQMAEEGGHFDFEAVAQEVADKMIRRHPHVFADTVVTNTAAINVVWEDVKAAERQVKDQGETTSLLDGVPLALPALSRAEKLQKRAARGGFDWSDARLILDKIEEEIAELKAEIDQAALQQRIEDELGDLLFALVNLARHLQLDPEEALRGANRKFERRFRHVEHRVARAGRQMADMPLEQLEAHWRDAKDMT